MPIDHCLLLSQRVAINGGQMGPACIRATATAVRQLQAASRDCCGYQISKFILGHASAGHASCKKRQQQDPPHPLPTGMPPIPYACWRAGQLAEASWTW